MEITYSKGLINQERCFNKDGSDYEGSNNEFKKTLYSVD